MFVLEALLLTFATTPLVTFFYPQECRVRVAATGANFNNVPDGNEEGGSSRRTSRESGAGLSKTRFTVVLDKLEHIPGMMVMAQLIQPSIPTISPLDGNVSGSKKSLMKLKSAIPSIEALRLIELSDRTSAVMKSSAAESILLSDPLLSIFKMFGQLNDIVISTALSIVPLDDLSHAVADNARDSGSEMIMLPWLPFLPPTKKIYLKARLLRPRALRTIHSKPSSEQMHPQINPQQCIRNLLEECSLIVKRTSRSSWIKALQQCRLEVPIIYSFPSSAALMIVWHWTLLLSFARIQRPLQLLSA